MNTKERMILTEYREQRPAFLALGDTVHELLSELVKKAGIDLLSIEHRVKAEDSLKGKLERKGDRYSSLADLTDIMGARVICFFNDDVDAVGKIVEETFVIDWENSADKRAEIKADTFGYLSLHYICSLAPDSGYPAEICEKKFEIQIRTVLQHAWAAINHDMGYKSEFGVPRIVVREFSRVAGLLEIADDEFVRIRQRMGEYVKDIRRKITENRAEGVLIDALSLKEYVSRNRNMREFLEQLAAICGAEIQAIDPESYLEQLRWLGKRTLGDLQQMMEDNRDLAFALAERALSATDLDILSSNVGLRYLCRAELYNKGYSQEQAAEFLRLSVKDEGRSVRQAKSLYDSCRKVLEAENHG